VRRNLKNAILHSALLLSAVCGGFAEDSSTPPDLTLQASVSEVRLMFSTTNQDSRVIDSIQPSDFAIVDQDVVVHDFRSFNRADYTRLDVAVLVDASGSISSQFRRELENAVQVIAHLDNVPEESFSVISFRDLKPSIVCAGNCRTLMANAPLPVLQSGGLTPLYDSVVFASGWIGQAQTGSVPAARVRRILVLFSDGVDTISVNSFNEAVNSALDNDVILYTIDVSRTRNLQGTRTLRSFSFNTAGRYFSIDDGAAKVIDAILEDCKATYSVAYKLPNSAAGFHEVRILPTHNSGLLFHCRRGYYYPNHQEN